MAEGRRKKEEGRRQPPLPTPYSPKGGRKKEE